MKILFVNEKAGYFGGVEQNVATAAQALHERGHRCFLAHGDPDGAGRDFQRHFEAVHQAVELMPGSSAACGSMRPFEEIVRKTGPDVLYLHKVPSIRSLDLVSLGIRSVRMVHDYDVTCPRKHKYYAISQKICRHKADWRCWADLAFLEKDTGSPLGIRWVDIPDRMDEMRAHHRLDKVLVGSRAMRNDLLMNGFGAEKVGVLPPAVRLEAQEATPLPDTNRILYVGQLIRGKGVDLFLRALQKISAGFTATLIGTGNAGQELRELCGELGLWDKVRFEGWVPNDDIGRHYEAARFVVVPSRWPEPFGMVGLEAMRHGRAVVAFEVGGIPDWLEHERTGLLVKEQDVAAMAAAIERLLTDPVLAATLGRNGSRRVREKFGFDAYIDALEGHLQCA